MVLGKVLVNSLGNGSVIGGNLALGMGWGASQSDSSRKFPLVWGRFWECLREWFGEKLRKMFREWFWERFRKGLGNS